MSGGLDWDRLPELVGRELGVTDWVVVDQRRVDGFAEVTDDRQWIHVDAERARRESPLGTTIAHGFLTLSLLARFAYELGLVPPEGTHLLNYGLGRVRFLAPVKTGARIRDRVVLLRVEDKRPGQRLVATRHTVEIEGEDKPALVAESLVLLVRKGT
jgi:acyl dehydratase